MKIKVLTLAFFCMFALASCNCDSDSCKDKKEKTEAVEKKADEAKAATIEEEGCDGNCEGCPNNGAEKKEGCGGNCGDCDGNC